MRRLSLSRPLPPMEALSVASIPRGPQWVYEPKWDGFRCLVFRDRDDVDLQSKAGRPMARYFPEIVAAVAKLKAKRFALDGELIVPVKGALSFDALLQRIHPAASRIHRLAEETPAILILFDMLAGEDGRSLLRETLDKRREHLESFFGEYCRNADRLRLSPETARYSEAKRWLGGAGAALDGVIAKRRDLDYRSGERTGMQKIKNIRSVDCVIGGFRYNEGRRVVGSLLLGLYDDAGLLHHVGFTSTIKEDEKPALTEKLKPFVGSPGFTGNAPGGPSRWSTKRSEAWVAVKPKLVVEVSYYHFTGDRFRHGTRLLRWRPDKAPRQCTLDQLKQQRQHISVLA
jgi:ATP-dependent DNA ligase